MEKPKVQLFSQKAQAILAQFDAIAQTSKFVAEEGPLEKEIRSFLVSVAGMLKRDCQLQDWHHSFPRDDDGYIYFQMFPKAWELPKVGPVALCVCWSNPFASEPEDLYVGLRIPWNYLHRAELKSAVAPHIPEGFTDITDIESADQNDAYWQYLKFQDFVTDERFDAVGFYQAIQSAFRSLLSLHPVIDDYVAKCSDMRELRSARRELGILAVVDTETVGSQQELIELAVVNAAYDKQSGEVLGILDQYEGLREPKCKISKSDQRLNGLGIDEVRGRSLDEGRIKSLLKRADFVVAHNAPFDKARLVEQFKWAADLDWRDSLHGVNWDAETSDLPSLLTQHGIDCENSHRAGCDARALLELLSYKGGGGYYLRHLLSSLADAAEA